MSEDAAAGEDWRARSSKLSGDREEDSEGYLEESEDHSAEDSAFRSGEKDERWHDVRITQELLKQVQRELCLTELCWSETDARQDRNSKRPSNGYRTVGDKEKLLAWYAENFRRQFHARYPHRKPLLLTRENEFNVQKFVSTTIGRSTLPYPELYTWQGCAKFVSDYIEYEPLDTAFNMRLNEEETTLPAILIRPDS
ncbi:hypothetical protein KM043_000573 [Ampulex compressa]|nr:hypothetical protein KM043_000573 [Ampulex compressa]